MAELLVKLTDNDVAGAAWKRGDPVAVFEDGHAWGLEERPPKFAVVRIAGTRAEDVRKFLVAEFAADGAGQAIKQRRAWGVALDTKLPAAALRALQEQGVLTVALAQVRAYLTLKATGQTAVEAGA